VQIAAVVKIGKSAFRNCNLISAVNFPSLIELDESSFNNCQLLNTISCRSLSIIRDSVFYNCNQLSYMDMKFVDSIGNYSFYNCESIELINLPYAKRIGDYVFSFCQNLKIVEFQSLNSIGKYAFEECIRLYSGKFSNLAIIDKEAFKKCQSLSIIYLPEIPPKVYFSNEFIDCPISRRSIFLDSIGIPCDKLDSTYFKYKISNDGNISDEKWFGWKISRDIDSNAMMTVKFINNNDTLIQFKQNSINDAIQLNNVTNIVFIEISNGKVKQSDWTWLYYKKNNLSSLTHFIVTDSVFDVELFPENLPIQSFFGNNIKYVKIAKITKIVRLLFDGCYSLIAVSFPEAEIIDPKAFSNCTSLKEVYIPKVKKIRGEAFYSCISLVSINLDNTEIIEINAFRICSSLNNISLPSLEILGDVAFAECTSLKTAYIPKIKEIGNASFYNNLSLANIYAPNVNIINSDAFKNCSKLESVSFPKLKKIERLAFVSCSSLKLFFLPSNPPELDLNNNVGSPFALCHPIRRLVFVDTNGNPIKESSKEYKIYSSIEDENANDNLWYGWYISNYAAERNLVAKITLNNSDNELIINSEFLEGALKDINLNEINKIEIISGNFLFDSWEFLILNREKLINLTHFIINDSVSYVDYIPSTIEGMQLFSENLQYIYVAKTKGVGHNVFRECYSLRNAIFPNATYIGLNSFLNCCLLDSVFIPSAEIIDIAAFKGCFSMVSISLPHVKKMMAESFKNCYNLQTIHLSYNIPYLWKEEKLKNPNIEDLYATDNVFFNGKENKNVIFVDTNNNELLNKVDIYNHYKSYNDGNTTDEMWFGWKISELNYFKIYVKNNGNGRIITVPLMKKGEEVSINALPNNGYSLKPGSLKVYKYDDTSVVLPITNNVFIMKDFDICISADFEVNKLQVKINNEQIINGKTLEKTLNQTDLSTINKIEIFGGFVNYDDWFWIKNNKEKLSNLISFSISNLVNGVSSIPSSNAQKPYFPEAIENITIEKLNIIGNYAFFKSLSLKEINCPSTTIIGDYAFSQCINLISPKFENAKIINFEAFYMCKKMESIYFKNVKTIHERAFRECSLLIKVDFPRARHIGLGAFINCTILRMGKFPSAVFIGKFTFDWCNRFTHIYLPIKPPYLGYQENRYRKGERYIIFADTNGNFIENISVAQKNYRAQNDGDTNDNLWFNWIIPDVADSNHNIYFHNEIKNGKIMTSLTNEIPPGELIKITWVADNGYKLKLNSLEAYNSDDTTVKITITADSQFQMLNYDVTIKGEFEKINSNSVEINDAIKIYPNPVSNELYFANLKNYALVEIYNSLGICVLKQFIDPNANSLKIDLLQSGLYYVKIENIIQKIIKI